MSGDNPFADNPFAVGKTTNGSAPAASGVWRAGTAGAWGSGGGANRPPPPPTSSNAFTAPVFGGGSSKVADGADAREAVLNRREADLNRRETELRRLELELRNASGGKSKKNWPRYCSCVHHDIAGEVPAAMQGTVRAGYYAYIGLVACLVWNFVGTAGLLITDGKIASFLWGALYLLGGVPLGWFLWYGRLYNAAIKDSAFGYGLFFLFFSTAHLVFTGWSAIAPPILNAKSHTGFWITIQSVYSDNKGLGVVYFIGSALWAIEFLWSFWTLKKVYGAFRGQGLTAADVKRDAARGAASAVV
jgi:secretory carrier-associated membrane protein